VDSFSDFQAALSQKIVRETGQTPDGGSTLALLFGAITGMIALRRRMGA
jgi:hypothetical protein